MTQIETQFQKCCYDIINLLNKFEEDSGCEIQHNIQIADRSCCKRTIKEVRFNIHPKSAYKPYVW